MPSDGTFLDALGLSEWPIRPGRPPLSLFVREITSVSVTFILSSTFFDFGAEAEPFLASLGPTAEDDNEDDDGDDETDDSVSAEQKKTSIISEVLAKGLSVNVNSATWKGVYIRIDDKTDEAVIIIYGLMPGKKYDIDLGLVQGGQSNNIRRQVTTDDLEMPNSTSLPEVDTTHFESAESPLPTPSTSPSRTMTSTPPITNPHPQLTLEDRLNQLQHTLSLIASERDSLSLSLKTARRDAQKADAALRSEIEILKRASEKHSVAEHRARQKVLALQEAAKRAQMSTREMEEQVVEVEAELPALRRQRGEKEGAYSKIKEDADRVRKEREREEEKERRKLDLMKSELTGLNNKMERVNGKKDKLETSVIPDLQEQLREIELEIERVEEIPWGMRIRRITSTASTTRSRSVDTILLNGPANRYPGSSLARRLFPSNVRDRPLHLVLARVSRNGRLPRGTNRHPTPPAPTLLLVPRHPKSCVVCPGTPPTTFVPQIHIYV
ncbi:hypothetical protein B0H12DRAFT_1236521 [Mycena haematopus]|nr:hypothetical protein B0H12DRAFT_1236521 [Mycena haematopus]